MNLLYGLASEGMGHTTRSKVVIEYLRSQSHRVLVATSGRAAKLLGPNDLIEIVGLVLAYDDGAMDFNKSILANVARIQQLFTRQAEAFREVDHFAPDAVVTDLEPFATFYASTRSLPLIAIGNHGIVTRCEHDSAIVGATCDPHLRGLIFLAEPSSARAIVTTIATMPIKTGMSTVLVPPILRKSVIDAKPTDGEHVLVYQTSASAAQRLINTLRTQPATKFVVYGLGRAEEIGNVSLRTFSEEGFLSDLASARAVITNGGYSLTSEAVALGKPIYSIPVRNHFEQAINARYVRALGFGDTAEFIEPAGVAGFLQRAPEYAWTLRETPRHDANAKLYQTLDSFFATPTATW